MPHRLLSMLGLLSLVVVLSALGQPYKENRPYWTFSEEICRPAAPAISAQALIAQAQGALGMTNAQGQILAYDAVDVQAQQIQSDRMYPPYLTTLNERTLQFDTERGVEYSEDRGAFPGGKNPNILTTVSTDEGVFMQRDTLFRPVAGTWMADLALNPWAVLYAWAQDPTVKTEAQCHFRDYWRTVLVREKPGGAEKLYLDPKTHFPVRLVREEPHYLWGQSQIEYIYSTWVEFDGGFLPGASFRLMDGLTEVTRTMTSARLMARSEQRWMQPPAFPAEPPVPFFLRPDPPQTVEVADNLYLLVNPGYTQAVAFIKDTLYVFDATQGEARARQDEARIRERFPGNHPVVLVVTDTAWPHVAGMRYWIAKGATIVSHSANRPFLTQVFNQRWTRNPDLLEQRRSAVSFKFEGIEALQARAGGAVQLFPIDGASSEAALIAYLPEVGFLWAGDYIQRTDQASTYATEVYRAVQREGFTPTRTAAQHLPLTDWSVVAGLQQ